MRIHGLFDLALLVSALAVPAQQHEFGHKHEHLHQPKQKRQAITDPNQQGIYDYIVGKWTVVKNTIDRFEWEKLTYD